jgi:hypothetical protein
MSGALVAAPLMAASRRSMESFASRMKKSSNPTGDVMLLSLCVNDTWYELLQTSGIRRQVSVVSNGNNIAQSTFLTSEP